MEYSCSLLPPSLSLSLLKLMVILRIDFNSILNLSKSTRERWFVKMFAAYLIH
ncbi:uncharacterized protein DS421_13g404890 [Arachis hypogaea]|nr:uncharacterized protein DS421_13g404890 [Arachis hypogaea]